MHHREFALTLALLGALHASATSAEPGPTFPALTADNLARERIALPGGLAGRYNLVIVAYRQRQQPEVDTWMPALNALERENPAFRWYELPTIGKFTGLFVSLWLDDAMRSGIPDPQQRARTITIYVDKDWFRGRLGLPQNDDAIHLILIDKSGTVLWRRSGPFAAAALDELRKTLIDLR